MRLLVFGASGGCGSWLVRFAVERGHDVTAVVRSSSPYEPPKGTAVETGEITSPEFVRSAVPGHDVVLSCVGLRRAGVHPWARLISPPDLVQTFTRHLVDAVADDPVRRIVWISAGGVLESRLQATASIRRMIRAGNVGVAYDDLEQAESAIPSSDGRWLAVRPVTLLNGAPKGNAGEVRRYGLLSTVRRADVAQWMLDVADGNRSYEKPAVLLGTVRLP